MTDSIRPNKISELHATGAGAYKVALKDIELSDESMKLLIENVLAFSR